MDLNLWSGRDLDAAVAGTWFDWQWECSQDGLPRLVGPVVPGLPRASYYHNIWGAPIGKGVGAWRVQDPLGLPFYSADIRAAMDVLEFLVPQINGEYRLRCEMHPKDAGWILGVTCGMHPITATVFRFEAPSLAECQALAICRAAMMLAAFMNRPLVLPPGRGEVAGCG